LQLVTVRRIFLHGILVSILLVVGFMGLRGGWNRRVAIVLGLVLAVLLCGVFLPTLGQQLVDGATVGVSSLWAFIWILDGTVTSLRQRWASLWRRGVTQPSIAADPAAMPSETVTATAVSAASGPGDATAAEAASPFGGRAVEPELPQEEPDSRRDDGSTTDSSHSS
jgi:hypothetical protein